MVTHSVTCPILYRHCHPDITFKSCNIKFPEAQTRWTAPLLFEWRQSTACLIQGARFGTLKSILKQSSVDKKNLERFGFAKARIKSREIRE